MTAIFENRDIAADVAERLRVYAQPLRLMILSCLLRGERTVAEIGEITGITQPALSQQLAELRRAELVNTRKEAKQVWYALADDRVMSCVQTMEAVFCGQGQTAAPAASTRAAAVDATPGGVAGFARIV
ncbi:ArsR/SmtB family transcription factor [Alteraurantiacibacter palmitatis]|uniref:ArsR/SmtB family transcription factor n=1 Tax=Alteraurantiacibacter palmitatis TaxID=2054628 RepID=A0ABV7ECD3_9SPHN